MDRHAPFGVVVLVVEIVLCPRTAFHPSLQTVTRRFIPSIFARRRFHDASTHIFVSILQADWHLLQNGPDDF